MVYQCSICLKKYAHREHLSRHMSIHRGKSFSCGNCNKNFNRKDNFERHQRNCRAQQSMESDSDNEEELVVSLGDVNAPSWEENRVAFQKQQHKGLKRKRRHSESETGTVFSSKKAAFNPSPWFAYQDPSSYDPNPLGFVNVESSEEEESEDDYTPRVITPWNPIEDCVLCPPSILEGVSDECRECFQNNWRYIRTHERSGQYCRGAKRVFNVRLEDDTSIPNILAKIYLTQQHPFKMNISFGFMLKNNKTGEVKYYYPSENTRIFEKPQLVATHQDLVRVQEGLGKEDWLEKSRQQRENSEWDFSGLTNFELSLFPIHYKRYISGQVEDFPEWLLENKGLDALIKNDHGVEYKDNLCYFRCLARFKGHGVKALEKPSKKLYNQYLRTLDNPTTYQGVTLEDLAKLDKLFDVRTEVFQLDEDGVCQIIRKAPPGDLPIMKINLWKNHFSYIKNFTRYCQVAYCHPCETTLANAEALSNHKCPASFNEMPPYWLYTNRGLEILYSKKKKKGDIVKESLFRCLARHHGTKRNLEREAEQLMEKYVSSLQEPHKFRNVKLEDLTTFEQVFDVDVFVYQQSESGNVSLLRRPHKILKAGEFQTALKVNFYNKQYSYINDMNKYAKSFRCERCDMCFNRANNFHRHENSCDGKVKKIYKGGIFTPPLTVFDELEEESIHVPSELRFSKYRATYDIEVFYPSSSSSLPSNSEKVEWKAEHNLLSISVASNVPGYQEPKCFVVEIEGRDERKRVIELFISHLNNIAEKAEELETLRYANLIESINSQLDMENEGGPIKQKKLSRLLEKLENHIQELPVVGFNTARYDLNVLQRELIPHLVKEEGGIDQTIKKSANNYMVLKSQNLKFIDITNFLAPGTNYDAFLKAYQCQTQKGHFPYEYLDSLDKLKETQLPPKEAFNSWLRKTSISDEDYELCQKAWNEHEMCNLKDFLIWYNNLDVVPFLEALDKMCTFWQDHKIDMLKEAVSLPGLAFKFEMSFLKEQNIHLSSFHNEESYERFANNDVGGPSIVFHRHAEVGKTFVRNNPEKPVKNVVGYDANGLYLWALCQPMPTGLYIEWRPVKDKDNLFHVKEQKVWKAADEWLAWESEKLGRPLRTRLNNTEKRVGPKELRVDGWDAETNTIYEFMGCYWHGCTQCFESDKIHPSYRPKTFGEVRRETEERLDYLRALSYPLKVVWEKCEWQKSREYNSPEFQACLKRVFPLRNELDKKRTLGDFLNDVKADEFFGCLEVDIITPPHLREKFSEMCPVFKNVNVESKDIGEHMGNFAREHQCMTSPRRALIGSYFGEKILLATPLLKFYLEEGLVVTKLHYAIQWVPKSCLLPFGDFVCNARRQADVDPSKKILGETAKLVGNSGFGRFIMNKEKHHHITYAVNDSSIHNWINSPHFLDLEEFPENVIEIERLKSKVKLNLPRQIGYFVFQYAKLRMLEFYYRCVGYYVDRCNFQYIQMDTDSAYMSLAGNSLEELVKEDKKEEFETEKHLWFPRTDSAENAAHDKRKLGLFKKEWSGVGMVALNSKTYCGWEEGGKTTKISSKGINKKLNKLQKDLYLEVLQTKESQSGENRGFRVLNKTVYTYSQHRQGFTYFYPKRKVLEDGVSTTPLDI